MTFIQKILFTILIFTSANQIELNQNLMMDMSRAYGYSVGQTIYLDAIERKYPSLKNQVFLAKNEFNLKFSKSLNEIEYTFTKNMTQEQWSDFKFKLKNDLERQLDYNSITQNDAINFIDEVKTRANGNIESPIIETLIMFNPNYQNNPISELNDNFFQRYNSKDNPKAKGVNFSVKIPKSYKDENNDERSIYFDTWGKGFLDKPLIGDTDIVLIDNGKEKYNIDANKVPSGYVSIGSAHSAFGDLDIYINPNKKSKYGESSKILISGLYQFDHNAGDY